MMRALTFLRAAIAIVVLATVVVSPSTMAYANEVIFEHPNILVVMVDDLGFSDIGCYGGGIDTPNLDQLADDGLRFSQFYSTAKCHSSRISLLTGRYAFQAGNTSLKRAVTSAEVLGDGGYFTAMTGKWHLDEQPTDFGFQRYFGHLSGACNYYTGDKTFRLNGEPWHVPSDGFYTTVANVDFALQFLKEARQPKKPRYLYVAFNAPHAPLQPLEEDYKKCLCPTTAHVLTTAAATILMATLSMPIPDGATVRDGHGRGTRLSGTTNRTSSKVASPLRRSSTGRRD